MKPRVGVIGVGYLGRFHAQKYKASEKCTLSGVYDVSTLRAQEVATELNVRSFGSVDELLGQVDAVSIASSTSSHYEIAKMAIQRKLHVLLEKPMTLTSVEAEELVRLAEKFGVLLQVGHIERFNPAFQLLRRQVKKITSVEARRLASFKVRGIDADVVFDLMIHDIDLALDLVKTPVRQVRAQGQKFVTKGWDCVRAWLTFEGGVEAFLMASRVSPTTERRLWVQEASTHWEADLAALKVTKSESLGLWDGVHAPIQESTEELQKVDALATEVAAFIEAVINKTKPPVSGHDGLSNVRVAERIVGALTA